MVAGVRRTVSPSPEECKVLGEELLKWATEESEDFRFRFAQWYSEKKGILRKEWKTLIQRPEFMPYYEKVQSIFATKCLLAVREGFGHRYLRLYDRDLIEEENEHARFEAEIKAKEQKLATEEDQKRFDMFMHYLKEVKETHSSALNNADKRNSSDT